MISFSSIALNFIHTLISHKCISGFLVSSWALVLYSNCLLTVLLGCGNLTCPTQNSGTSTSCHLTGIRFNFTFARTKETKQNTWNSGFQNIVHQAMRYNDPWETGNKQGEPYSCPGFLSGESFKVTAHGRENHLDISRDWSWSWEFEEAMVARVRRAECQRG